MNLIKFNYNLGGLVKWTSLSTISHLSRCWLKWIIIILDKQTKKPLKMVKDSLPSTSTRPQILFQPQSTLWCTAYQTTMIFTFQKSTISTILLLSSPCINKNLDFQNQLKPLQPMILSQNCSPLKYSHYRRLRDFPVLLIDKIHLSS